MSISYDALGNPIDPQFQNLAESMSGIKVDYSDDKSEPTFDYYDPDNFGERSKPEVLALAAEESGKPKHNQAGQTKKPPGPKVRGARPPGWKKQTVEPKGGLDKKQEPSFPLRPQGKQGKVFTGVVETSTSKPAPKTGKPVDTQVALRNSGQGVVNTGSKTSNGMTTAELATHKKALEADGNLDRAQVVQDNIDRMNSIAEAAKREKQAREESIQQTFDSSGLAKATAQIDDTTRKIADDIQLLSDQYSQNSGAILEGVDHAKTNVLQGLTNTLNSAFTSMVTRYGDGEANILRSIGDMSHTFLDLLKNKFGIVMKNLGSITSSLQNIEGKTENITESLQALAQQLTNAEKREEQRTKEREAEKAAEKADADRKSAELRKWFHGQLESLETKLSEDFGKKSEELLKDQTEALTNRITELEQTIKTLSTDLQEQGSLVGKLPTKLAEQLRTSQDSLGKIEGEVGRILEVSEKTINDRLEKATQALQELVDNRLKSSDEALKQIQTGVINMENQKKTTEAILTELQKGQAETTKNVKKLGEDYASLVKGLNKIWENQPDIRQILAKVTALEEDLATWLAANEATVAKLDKLEAAITGMSQKLEAPKEGTAVIEAIVETLKGIKQDIVATNAAISLAGSATTSSAARDQTAIASSGGGQLSTGILPYPAVKIKFFFNSRGTPLKDTQIDISDINGDVRVISRGGKLMLVRKEDKTIHSVLVLYQVDDISDRLDGELGDTQIPVLGVCFPPSCKESDIPLHIEGKKRVTMSQLRAISQGKDTSGILVSLEDDSTF